jgi:hypothetical protein
MLKTIKTGVIVIMVLFIMTAIAAPAVTAMPVMGPEQRGTISLTTTSVLEGTDATLTFSASAPITNASLPASFDVTVTDTEAGVTYTPFTVTVPADSPTATVSLPILDNRYRKTATRDITLTFSNADNCMIPTPVTIPVIDDGVLPTLTLTSSDVHEGVDGGTLTFGLDKPADVAVYCMFIYNGHSYMLRAHGDLIEFAPGETTDVITVNPEDTYQYDGVDADSSVLMCYTITVNCNTIPAASQNSLPYNEFEVTVIDGEETHSMDLVKGWNFVSSPYWGNNFDALMTDNIEASFTPAPTNGDNIVIIWNYVDGEWHYYMPNTVYNSVSYDQGDMSRTFDPALGYWILATEAFTMDVVGHEGLDTPDLNAGWNLIGFPNAWDDNSVDESLGSIVWNYINSIQSYGNNYYTSLDGYVPGALTNMEVGKAYWVYAELN